MSASSLRLAISRWLCEPTQALHRAYLWLRNTERRAMKRIPEPVSIPGPTLVLTRRTAEIALFNQLPEATAVHWHGIELDSYYDGVHGWSGAGSRVTKLIQPGESFAARMNPPRTGTFIYYIYLHDDRQLTAGLYGALLVLEPDEIYDQSAGSRGCGQPRRHYRDRSRLLNGETAAADGLESGHASSNRFVNTTPGDIFAISRSTG